jgi:hypothetical protein
MGLISAAFPAKRVHIRNLKLDSVYPALWNAALVRLHCYAPVAIKIIFFSMIENVARAVVKVCSQILKQTRATV